MNGRNDEIDDAIAVEGRLYLLTANAACWKCRQPQDVVVIAAQGLSEGGEAIPDTQNLASLIILSAIEEMPSQLLAFIPPTNQEAESLNLFRSVTRPQERPWPTPACAAML
jgi:hypothetical protein